MSVFFLKTHLHPMVLPPSGKLTKFQTWLSYMDCISEFMALSHLSESGPDIAS
ncbi:hypothetical protein Syun_022749 [Stephania yunnanensis]|uniref:Uncharacterized protein n=1 Tax=Stephania yunnanensis TaxID=152371 RepID=A0AAP0HYU8_9MAGN